MVHGSRRHPDLSFLSYGCNLFMASPDTPRLLRQQYFLATDTQARTECTRALLRLFLLQDGSTTRLCETMARDRLTVHVLAQAIVPELPVHLAGALPGRGFLRRITALEMQKQVLLDSISYIALDALDADNVARLEAGTTPIGHVLATLWTKRSFRSEDQALFDELWRVVGQADAQASRSYTVFTPQGPCMVIAETFRRGIYALAASGET
jgi:chorismate-pyruvate lyase